MKRLFKTTISKIYVAGMLCIIGIILISYYSYAMFTVKNEKNNAISIVTGNLVSTITIDGISTNQIVIPANTTQIYTVILVNNNNNRSAKFNLYYKDNLTSSVVIGYINDSANVPPTESGIVLKQGAYQTYKIKVKNDTINTVTITLCSDVGLDYNDLAFPNSGWIIEKYPFMTVSETLLLGVGENGKINTDDQEQIFITGIEPNNYIWYSGKLWRAVSIDLIDNSVKLITQWNISAIPYNARENTIFEGSYMEEWLNDTSVDGFLGNLREPEKFIKMDSKWNATMTTENTKPAKTTIVEDAVGLLNIYEYIMSYRGTDIAKGYLNNGLYWFTLTPYSEIYVRDIGNDGTLHYHSSSTAIGVRSSLNLKSNVEISSGDGTEKNPYRLNGDNDTPISGTLLNTRYSGEYLHFGKGENNLYRIVSHENERKIKIVSSESLKENGIFKTVKFGDNTTFSSNNTIGSFLNGEYLIDYLTVDQQNMIEDNNTWYLGIVSSGMNYKLAKYKDISMNEFAVQTNAKIGLLRIGEQLTGQFNRYTAKDGATLTGLTKNYWLITPFSASLMSYGGYLGDTNGYTPTNDYGVRPTLYLKPSVKIISGDGTKEKPFEISL